MAFPSLLVWVSSSAAMAYVYYGIMRLPKGFIRLTASLPLMAFYVYMAPRFETVFERGNYSFFFIWLTSFKIILLCWDDGPAADPWAMASFSRFLIVMNLSLQIKRESFGERSKKQVVHTRMVKKPSTADSPSESHIETDMVATARDRKFSAAATKRTIVNHSDVVTGFNGHEARTAERAPTQLPPRDWKAWVKWVDASQQWHIVVLRLLLKLIVLMLLTSSYIYRSSIPSLLLYIIYSLHLYISCSLLFEGITAVVSPMLGIQLEAPYNTPFLAHSLSNFWGQRWNLLVSNLLRVSVYDPVLRCLLRNHVHGQAFTLLQSKKVVADGQISINKPALLGQSETSSGSPEDFKVNTTSYAAAYAFNRPPLLPRCIAMFSSFLVSGLMHELIFYNMSRSKPTWVSMIFFPLNGAATMLEVAVRRKTRLRLSKYISIPLTLTFVLVTAAWFLYPAIINEAGTDAEVIAEFQYFFHRLRQLVGGS
ncbi:hypothetical protein KC19_9G107700 [Ceratodon purpureus]|uniref:Wax synthase domain-containing protein n=1 Tax=Ceratodon purpureus TaxID=3225 RepID=A0A8T0GW90_CERPU|nr:hypothetical protein KC19_9G107700 [Ceratodon purpureus]